MTMSHKVLNGITWNHTRGIMPLLAASQRYCELNPEVDIRWQKRSLQEFADFPIEKLTEKFDLLVIDHPWVGCAAVTKCVLPLNEYLADEYLEDQLLNSVGYSHLSYNYNGKQWALAIDAATPVASYRQDLFTANNVGLPASWEDVISLATEGKVAVPGIAVDLLMNFYSFCIAHGKSPFSSEEEVIDKNTGARVIGSMKELYSIVDKKMFTKNPIAVAELMTSSNQYWYCPFAYAYSNYSREGYARHCLSYTDVVTFAGKKLQTTIGGTGLAVSTFSGNKDVAIDFAIMVASAEFQRTQYVQSGGQPGHLSAWQDTLANRLSNNFFLNVLPVIENAFMRPRYNGYLYFQEKAGELLHECLLHDGDEANLLEEMNKIYRSSFVKAKPSIY